VVAARAALIATGVAVADAERLVGLYGSEAGEVGAGGEAAEATRAVLHEGALRLEDYWVRRSARAFFTTDGGMGALGAAAQAMAPLLGWSAARTDAEIAHCRQIRDRDMGEII
jgi:glycerol-3-phosphate dehydrogenase